MTQYTPERRTWDTLTPTMRATFRSFVADAPAEGAVDDIMEAFGKSQKRAEELAGRNIRSVFTERTEVLQSATSDLLLLSQQPDVIESLAAEIPVFLEGGKTDTAINYLGHMARIVFSELEVGLVVLPANEPQQGPELVSA